MSREQEARLYARVSIFKRRIEEARAVVARAFETAPRWYVALSGGKDSTCALALAREVCPDTPAVFSDDEWWLPETEEYTRRLSGLHWIRTNARHTSWFSTKGDFDGIPDYAQRQGFEGCFLGLRKDENSYRRVHLNTRGLLYFCQRDEVWHCNPIANWTARDVWAFIHSNEIDYNRAYDRLEEIGIPLDEQRIGPFAVERAIGYGQLATLKRGWPDLFNRFALAHPEARNYA
ncbi:MAG TPA: phosphoadenosine phosphosulfate reductase family protein [Pyrinomonadaceae bacterium]